jgi:hypothetical protein
MIILNWWLSVLIVLCHYVHLFLQWKAAEALFCILFQMKTVSVALVLCLNVGVDPPDVVKINPCARLECWVGKCITHCLMSEAFRLTFVN